MCVGLVYILGQEIDKTSCSAHTYTCAHMHTLAFGLMRKFVLCWNFTNGKKKSATTYILDRGRTSHMTVVKPVKNHQSALKQLASVNMAERN